MRLVYECILGSLPEVEVKVRVLVQVIQIVTAHVEPDSN
jgi:hypothetical protein